MPSGLKESLLLPAPNREGCIFGLARQKNRMYQCTTAAKFQTRLILFFKPEI